MTDEAQPRPIEPDDTTVTPINGETKLSELAWSSAAEIDEYAAPVTTTRYRVGCHLDTCWGGRCRRRWDRLGGYFGVPASARGREFRPVYVQLRARADGNTSAMQGHVGHGLEKDVSGGEVVVYLDRRGVAFGDDRQMYNYAIQIQTGDVPLNVC